MESLADSNRAIDVLFKARVIMFYFVYNCPVLYARPNRLPILPRVSWNYCTTLPSRARIDLETPTAYCLVFTHQPSSGYVTIKTGPCFLTELQSDLVDMPLLLACAIGIVAD